MRQIKYKRIQILGLLIILMISPLVTKAQIQTREFDSVAQQQLYQTMVAELRCLVCLNQSLSDSNAQLANDLKDKIFNMVITGYNKDEIVKYMTDRYGDFVLYKPRLTTNTFILWFSPFILLIIILLLVVKHHRRQQKRQA